MAFRRVSPAFVIALLALFVSLGGVSYGLAAGSIGSRELEDGGVRSRDIRNDDIRGLDIRRGAVGSGDVRDRSLRAVDFASGQLAAGPQGPAGRDGAPGPVGPQGPAGPAGTIASAAAGGDLRGSYPDPSIAPGAVTPDRLGTLPAATVTTVGLPPAQSIPSGESPTDLEFDSEAFDTMGLHDPAQPSLLRPPIDGTYLITASVEWEAAVGGRRELQIDATGARVAATSITPNAFDASPFQSVTAIRRLGVGSVVTARVTQTSGAPLAVRELTGTPTLSIAWIGP